MFTSSFNLIKCSSFENMKISDENICCKSLLKIIYPTKVFISSIFIEDISLISNIYKLCITSRLFVLFNSIPFK